MNAPIPISARDSIFVIDARNPPATAIRSPRNTPKTPYLIRIRSGRLAYSANRSLWRKLVSSSGYHRTGTTALSSVATVRGNGTLSKILDLSIIFRVDPSFVD